MDLGEVDGKRERRTRPTKQAAETFAAQARIGTKAARGWISSLAKATGSASPCPRRSLPQAEKAMGHSLLAHAKVAVTMSTVFGQAALTRTIAASESDGLLLER